MAEVYLAEAVSVQGFKKKVTIKRVLPHLAQNKNFIGMFLDEARLGAKLTHTNIVSVIDIGSADNTYFIVMEFVDGCNLKKVIEVLRKHGRQFPLKEAIYISMEACRGLSFAHELCEEDGEPLHIVHRDVSPPNILISKRGEVKVTDFGLAKATTQLEKTDPGVVKGKFSYLAPEAAMGQEVDARADVFAMGIVLWEMLAGRRLFIGENDFQTVKLVQQANVPSISRLNPEVDAELEQVLNKALTRETDQRYQSASEFADALAGYLFSHKLKVTSADIATLVKQTLAEEGELPKSPQQQSIIDKLIQEELVRFTSLDGPAHALDLDAMSPESMDDGAKPLDAGSFENPAAWFSDDELGGELGAQLEGGDEKAAAWVETAVEKAGETPQRVSSRPSPTAAAAVASARPESPAPAAAPEAKGSGKGTIVAVVAALAIAGAAVAAYFLR